MPSTAAHPVYGLKIRFNRDEDLREDGQLRISVINTAGPKLLRSILATFNVTAQPAINPRLRFRTDPRGIMVDLIVDRSDEIRAVTWRAHGNWAEGAFRTNFEVAFAKMAAYWAAGDHAKVIHTDDATIQVTSD